MGTNTKGLCYPVAADFSTASSIRLGEEAEEGAHIEKVADMQPCYGGHFLEDFYHCATISK